MNMLLPGLALGVAVAAPVGPMALLCLQRTLARGLGAGLATGLGIALADAAYGAVAATGLAAAATIAAAAGVWLRLAGGVVLLWLGWRAWHRPLVTDPDNAPAGRLAGDTVSALLLTLANPTTILSFAAAFAGLGLLIGERGSLAGAAWLVAGVFAGSVGWWLALSGAVTLTRRRLGLAAMRAINRAAAVALAGLGAYAAMFGLVQAFGRL